MITFKQQLTVTEELVNKMANKLGYSPFIYVREEEGGGHKNPQSELEYVTEKAKEHMEAFFLPLGRELVDQQLQEARQQVEEQIITPVTDNFTMEVIVSE